MSLPSFLTPTEAHSLPLDQVALRVLAHLRAEEDSGSLPQIWGVLSESAWAPIVAQSEMPALIRILQEAWDWLYVHGLIASREPTQSTAGYTFVTRRGRVVLEDNGLARLQAELRLTVDLHPRIRDRVRPQFLLGEYELAAFAALREVEIRVRELSRASESLLGRRLMAEAFRKGGGLFDPSLDSGESEALMSLFQGAIGVFKNPPSHRQVEYSDATEASEVVLFADLLLRVLDQVEQRLAQNEA